MKGQVNIYQRRGSRGGRGGGRGGGGARGGEVLEVEERDRGGGVF